MMPSALMRRLQKELKYLQAIQAARMSRSGLEVLFRQDDEDEDAFAHRLTEARKHGKQVLAIEFIGPPGGPEEGTGPITEEDDDE